MPIQYTISYDGWYSMLKNFGEDDVFFTITAYRNDNPIKTFPVLLAFNLFLKQAEEMVQDITAIVFPDRNQFKPCHLPESVFVHQMEDMGFNIEAIVLKAIATKVDLEVIRLKTYPTDHVPKVWPELNMEFVKAALATKPQHTNYNLLRVQFKKPIIREVTDQFPIFLN